MTMIKYQFKGQEVGTTYVVNGKVLKIIQSFERRGAKVLKVERV